MERETIGDLVVNVEAAQREQRLGGTNGDCFLCPERQRKDSASISIDSRTMCVLEILRTKQRFGIVDLVVRV